ncbi:hypothetical protein CH341_08335 [Rhodoplanes roseus]|uniref:Diguanylate cyclase n=2 Tax=Rhodoplanes roseus TaxID=29409 RepID=A0A327L0T5_9BRAD|nr:hypothetical protein CH341_08335 [Rhodoplanes roseus]
MLPRRQVSTKHKGKTFICSGCDEGRRPRGAPQVSREPMEVPATRGSDLPGVGTGRDSTTSLSALHFQTFCRIARAVFDVPAAAVCIGSDPFGCIDLAASEDREAWAFATSAAGHLGIAGPMLWVEDTLDDAAWAGRSYVTGAPKLRFIASMPFGPAGIGRLSLFDTRARAASLDGFQRLEDLGTIAGQQVSLVKAARAAADREAEFRLLAETSTDTIVRGDLEGVRLYVSPSVKALLGYDPGDLVGRKAVELTHPDDLPAFWSLMNDVRAGRLDVAVSEQRQRHRDGSWVWMEASLRLTYDTETGQPNGYVASVRDIGRRKELEARLARLATSDELTGLPNRMLFAQRLLDAVDQTRRTGCCFAVLYMDIDGFKPVNDSLGHQAGDAVLREMATRVRSVLRTDDTVARLGGDEFAFILRVNRAGATDVAQRLIAVAERPFRYGDTDILVGLSIGIACAPDDGLHPDDLLTRADRALYRAKAAGKNTFCCFDEPPPRG